MILSQPPPKARRDRLRAAILARERSVWRPPRALEKLLSEVILTRSRAAPAALLWKGG